ncbi:MAG: hypothetical protein K2P74_12080 [Nitrosomonas sp.]|nr:hypothetical protein [Nitrosomonas sp.]
MDDTECQEKLSALTSGHDFSRKRKTFSSKGGKVTLGDNSQITEFMDNIINDERVLE